uniref:Uncharacterized protein n=1 Tax=Cacopsylla melanoneura TaxID=428564 RepID=A0A8D8QZQ1_9HEMI
MGECVCCGLQRSYRQHLGVDRLDDVIRSSLRPLSPSSLPPWFIPYPMLLPFLLVVHCVSPPTLSIKYSTSDGVSFDDKVQCGVVRGVCADVDFGADCGSRYAGEFQSG